MPAGRMPFETQDHDPTTTQKSGVKKVSSQPSIFDSMPKKDSPQDFEQKVQQKEERLSSYKTRAADLTMRFNKLMADKTLPVNKNVLQQEVEKEVLINMVKLAQEVNADINERDGEGNLSWIIVLLKTCLSQRDRINVLEYRMSQLEKKTEQLDKPKKSE